MVTYFVGADTFTGLVKIGRTHDLAQRMRTLQIGSPIMLALWAVIPGDCEIALHMEHRIGQPGGAWHHGEWFALSYEQVAALALREGGVTQTRDARDHVLVGDGRP
jgi:hypothetical protein